MKITKAMVIDFLEPFSPVSFLPDDALFAFEGVRLLSEPIQSPDCEYLYVGQVSHLKLLPVESLKNLCVICIGKQPQCEKMIQRHKANLIVLPEDTNLLTVANRLWSRFDGFKKWVNEVEHAILTGASYQELMETIQWIFGDTPVIFTDTAYNVLGSSLRQTPYNEKVNTVLESGYYPKDMTDDLAAMGYQRRGPKFASGSFIDTPTYMGCPYFVLPRYAGSGILQAFVTAYFVNSPPTEALRDVFNYFAGQILDYYLRSNAENLATASPLERFMANLIEHTREDEEYLIDRARALKIPLNDSYRLGIVQWEVFSSGQANYIITRLRGSFSVPIFKVMLYRQSVLVLMRGELPNLRSVTEANQSFEEFSDLLKTCGGHVGFSTVTDSLLKLDIAYKQASAAIHHGVQLKPDHRVFFYSRYYIYDMLDSYQGKFSLEDMYVQKLRLLQNQDDGHLLLLRTYLMTERSLTATSKLLHMHRNSAIYRLNKIQDILNQDLDDPDVRLRLLISFKVLEMLNGSSEEAVDLNPENPRGAAETE